MYSTDALIRVSLNDLSPNPWNPHRMTAEELEQLLVSLREDGQWRPILIVEMDVSDSETPDPRSLYRIVDGEHLYRALLHLHVEEGGPEEVVAFCIGKNSEIPAWKQKEIGQTINHGLRGSVEDPEKTQKILQDVLQHRSYETVARRFGMGITGVRHMATLQTPARGAAPPEMVRAAPNRERKNSTVALLFESELEQERFEELVNEVGNDLVDEAPYKGQRGRYRLAVLNKALELARDAVASW